MTPSEPVVHTSNTFIKHLLSIAFVCLCLSAFAQPKANFSATPTSGCAPLIVQFTDLSTGSPTEWDWDLGNGTKSAQKNPSTTYLNPGAYTVKLRVRSGTGSWDSLVKQNFIVILDPPNVQFAATSSTSGCFPFTVSFADNSTTSNGSLTNWSWDFGDGNTSTQQNPAHTYTSSGNFNVALTVTNSAGCFKLLVKPFYINVTPGVTADFTFSNPVNCKPPESISFTNTSTGPGSLTYQWAFGDGGTSTSLSPSHTYNSSGTYTPSLIVVSSQGCRDTVTKVNALTIGNLSATVSIPDKICLADSLKPINTSNPTPISSLWDFGDGTSSNAINPAKKYNAGGIYTVKLINTYSGCTDSTSKNVEVIASAATNFTTTTDSGSCKAPFTVQFTDTSPDAVSWQWDFGDGVTSSQQNPSHTYNALGNYTVKLTITNSIGCTGTLTKTNYIKIAKPVIQLLNLPTGGCLPFSFSPTANITTAGTVSSYFWSFGDGGTSTQQNPTHTYNTAGSFTVKLVITTNGGCTDSVVVANAVRTGSKTTTNFSASPLSACASQGIQFTDLSTGSPDEWLWDFGDGTTSSQQDPLHNFADAGTFSVTLTTYNNKCGDTKTISNYVTIQPPYSRFNVVYNCTNITSVSFKDSSAGATSWSWDFGDGNTSNQQNPSHTYAAPGVYTVSLTVTNGACTHTSSKNINLSGAVYDFTLNKTPVCRKSSVQFTPQIPSNVTITGIKWDFNDGTIINAGTGTVAHSFQNSGTYNVKMVLTNIGGCQDSIIKPVTVNGPVANYTITPTDQCIGQAVQFTNSSTSDGINSITAVLWKFGDGNTSSSNSATVNYTYIQPGNFTTTLKVTDAAGCSDSLVKANGVRIRKPIPDFSTADTLSCPGGVVKFTNKSSGINLTGYQWDFGDGNTSTLANPTHSYSIPGLYSVKLVAYESIGCGDSITKTNYIKVDLPKANFAMSDSFTICPPMQVKFTNQSTYFKSLLWKFGDGNTSTITDPQYSYSIPGVYTVTLIATSAGGCVDSMSRTVTVISNTTGNLTYSPLYGCYPQSIDFQIKTNNPVEYLWDFGDGTTLQSPDSNQTYIYNDPGFYLPKVVLKDVDGCLTPIIGIDTIKILGARAYFGADKTILCDNGTVQFLDSSYTTDVITSRTWDFGDGTTATNIINPTHTYNATGVYDITLSLVTQNGCSHSYSRPAFIKVAAAPQIDITGNTSYCIPATLQLSGDWLNPDTTTLNWTWSVDGNVYTGQTLQNINYPQPDSFNVALVATNNYNCSDTAFRNIIIHPLPTVTTNNDTTICLGQSVSLQANGAATYNWTPSTNLSCSNCANPIATPTDDVQYVVTGTSSVGCDNSDSIFIRVKKPFNITASNSDTLCLGESLMLSASGAENYLWSPSTGLSDPTSATPIANPATTTNYTVVGYDSSSCFYDTAYITVYVYDYPTVFAGNDTLIVGGSSIQLNAIASNDVISYLWSPPTYLNCTSCPDPVSTPDVNITYQVAVSNIAGCTTTDDVTIIVACQGNIFIPNAFTPNKDGKNDYFYPMGKGVQTVKKMIIYDRWGHVVFSKQDFAANDNVMGWDGTYQGQLQQTGVYIYQMEVVCGDGNVIPIKGMVTLIR